MLATGWPSGSCCRRRLASRAHQARPSSVLAAIGDDQNATVTRSAADSAIELRAVMCATDSRCSAASMHEEALAALVPIGRS